MATAVVVNGGVITMERENVAEVEGAAGEVIEEVVFDSNDLPPFSLK